MTTEEAVKACEFWTTTLAETQALGSTANPEVAEHFGCLTNKNEYQPERWSNPDRRGWAINVPRWVMNPKLDPSPDWPEKVENAAYTMIAAEIERRAQ